MKAVIYGRPGCPFCVRARETAKFLEQRVDGFSYEYIDMWENDISKEDLAVKAGKPVMTVPQVFVDDDHIGGSDDFVEFAERQ